MKTHDQTNAQSAKQRSETEIYSERAVWLCENRKTRFKTRIQGTLAQILQKYPDDYKLRLLAVKDLIKDATHEHTASTGE